MTEVISYLPLKLSSIEITNFSGCIGAYSKGEGKGSTFYLELPLFPKEAVIGLDDLPRGRQSLLLSAKMRRYDRYDNPGFGMHPKGSGFNSNISLADLISLDRKIRSRAGSSDYIFNSEISESRNISGRTSLGRIDLPPFGLSDSLKSSKNSGHSGISKAVDGKISFSSFFHRDSARVGCFIDEIDESLLEAGMRRKSGSGPYVKRRGSSFTVSESLKVFRVLVVDDSVPTRKLMHRVLSRKGYEVTCAEDGLDCLDIIYPSSAIEDSSDSNLADLYDIVIMDDNMPKMSGRDVAKTLRLKGFKGMICGVTGNTSPEDESSFIISGADLVFPKPLDFDLFEKTIRTHPRLVELLLNQVQAQGQGRGHSQGSGQGMSQGLGMSQRTGLGLGPSLRNSFDGGVLGQSLVLGQYRGPAPSPGPGSVHIPGPLVFPDYDPGPFPSFSIMGLESSV